MAGLFQELRSRVNTIRIRPSPDTSPKRKRVNDLSSLASPDACPKRKRVNDLPSLASPDTCPKRKRANDLHLLALRACGPGVLPGLEPGRMPSGWDVCPGQGCS